MENANLFLPEITISVRFKREAESELFTIKSSNDSADIFRRIFNADTFAWTEEFIMICLNRTNKVIGYYKVSSGCTTAALVDPKVIFTIALNCGAAGIVIAHNHPSGSLKPSREDDGATKKLVHAGIVLGVNVFDHLILTHDGFYSYKDDGLIDNYSSFSY